MNLVNGKTFVSLKGSLVRMKGYIDSNNKPTLDIFVSYQELDTNIKYVPEKEVNLDLSENTITQQLLGLFILDPKGFNTYTKHIRFGIGLCLSLNKEEFEGLTINNDYSNVEFNHDGVRLWNKKPEDGVTLSSLSLLTITTLRKVISEGLFNSHHNKQIAT